jgi:4-hydroxy-tetrahydrodipicolinate synthase
MMQLYSAIPTPFTVDGVINKHEMHSLIKHLLEKKCGIVLFGTTGEVSTISHEEIHEVLEFLEPYSFDKESFVLGVGGNNTAECKKMCEMSHKFGYKTIMITTPYYNKPSQDGLIAHFCEIASYHKSLFSDSKVVLYNVPGRTGINVLPETVLRIHDKCPNVVAIKEASGDLNQMMSIRKLVPEINLYSGDDGLVIPVMSIGGTGLISVVASLIPGQMNNIIDHCKHGDYSKAQYEYFKIHDLVKYMFCETNPVPVKYALHKMGIFSANTMRLPLLPMTNPLNQEKIDKLLLENLLLK